MTRHSPMDEDLPALERLRSGDEGGLTVLMERYREPVYRLALRYLGNVTDARELTEETFVRVYFNAAGFKPRARVRTWIFTIAANLCRDFLRRQKKHRRLQSLFAQTPDGLTRPLEESLADPERNAAEAVAGAEQLEAIHRAIHELPHALKFPFVFCVLEAHSHQEAAGVLGTSSKTVEMRIYRARKELQKKLRDSAKSRVGMG